jgi:hypothetical protein
MDPGGDYDHSAGTSSGVLNTNPANPRRIIALEQPKPQTSKEVVTGETFVTGTS